MVDERSSRRERVRALVVEDDIRFGALLQRALQTEGYAVDLAADGEEGLELLQIAPYDVAIVDVMLPKVSGLDLCRSLRRAQSDVPILMLTARDTTDDKVRGLDVGADDYLTKPVAFPELFARLRVLLRRRDGRRNPLLRVGDLSLDPARRRLQVGEVVVELTGKEFGILELLMRHPEQVFTRDEISEHVWDFAYEPGSNLIDVYVGRLRKKLGSGGAHLVTLRGQGYSLRP
jgi:DNA-binding response OmpR family regulator